MINFKTKFSVYFFIYGSLFIGGCCFVYKGVLFCYRGCNSIIIPQDLNNPPSINNENGTTNGQDDKGNSDFAFRYHRNTNNTPTLVYTVNDIAFNPVYGTFCTVGSDGNYSIWDKLNKSKLFERNDTSDKTPLTACDYNSNGNLLAFASG